MGLGNVPSPAKGGAFSMGGFQAPSSQLGDSQSRFDTSSGGARGVGVPFPPGAADRLTPMTRSASQGGVGGAGGAGGPREAKRTRSQRGNNRGDSMRAGGYQTPANQTMASLEPVAPLEQSKNRWVAGSTSRTPQQVEARALVDRKVKSLLNKLTMDKFDSISDQIIEWANKSEQEKDGSTLMQVIKLIFEKAQDEAGFSEMYARLCRKMTERVSPNVQDETIRNAEGQPITGGLLFRKYLLNRCQEDFERGWSAKEAAAALAASKAGDDKAAGEPVLYSEEHYAAAKAKRQGLGLVRFIGELFKLQMFTERVMHECIKKLLSNVVNPEEEEIESLCELLTTVGQSLDTAMARTHMDIYFERMQKMARGSHIDSRMQFMLQDVIELRHRHWQARSAVAQPSTIAAVHEQAERDEAASRNAIQRDGSRRDEHRSGDRGQQADGWNVAGGASAARPPAKAGDLSQFGKISKSTLSFGPTSVFNKAGSKSREPSMSRANSSLNMYAALNATDADGPPQPDARSGMGSRKPSVDLRPGGSPAAESGSVRKRLNLLPRTKPTETEGEKGEDEGTPELAAAAPAPMSEADAQKKVKEDIKEYLGVANVEEAIMALEGLPAEHHHIYVDRMVGAVLDGGNEVIVLAEKLFTAIHKQQACSVAAFERGLLPTVEMADDLSIDMLKTYEWLARLMHAAGIERPQAEELAGKISVYGEPRVHPKDLLIQAFDQVVLTDRHRKEKEHREREEKGRVEREREVILRQARENEKREKREKTDREERERVEQEEAELWTKVEEARLEAEAKAKAKAAVVERNARVYKPATSRQHTYMDSTHSETSTFNESWEQNNLAQHNPPDWVESEQTVEECIATCLKAEDIRQAINTFQTLSDNYRSSFIEKLVAAAFDGGSDSVAVVERLFGAARAQRICAPKLLEPGFLPAIESADDTSMDIPRTYEWLARLMHAAGLTKARVERMGERIIVVGEPPIEPKLLLAYEFGKLVG
ncbi:hypothetical protein FRC12_012029 [Ceratobasidium sp. 428]|nr:hypothetical protein FRC12_012029 [Ceratobasidium sp. 428]